MMTQTKSIIEASLNFSIWQIIGIICIMTIIVCLLVIKYKKRADKKREFVEELNRKNGFDKLKIHPRLSLKMAKKISTLEGILDLLKQRNEHRKNYHKNQKISKAAKFLIFWYRTRGLFTQDYLFLDKIIVVCPTKTRKNLSEWRQRIYFFCRNPTNFLFDYSSLPPAYFLDDLIFRIYLRPEECEKIIKEVKNVRYNQTRIITDKHREEKIIVFLG